MNYDDISQEDPAADEDIHGKLANLNAVPLLQLSLAMRYAYLMLLHPPNSDELGRFMTHGGALPNLPALSAREASLAIEGLIAVGLLVKWHHGASQCFELLGAYAYKPDLKQQLNQRRLINKRKRDETLKRRQRRKDIRDGVPYLSEEDETLKEDYEVEELIRTQRGNHVPTRAGVWFRSIVPPPTKQSRHKLTLPQPDSPVGCILKMLPSYNPGENLSKLGVLLRYYLHLEADDYGRVSLGVDRLHRQLGPAITKRVSKADIRHELREMVALGHLKDYKISSGWFAYLKDSAQHLLKKKNYNRNIPRLSDDKHFTYDSARYRAFFKACAEHASSRERVGVCAYAEKGKLKCISENVNVAAERFVKEYKAVMAKEPFASRTPAVLMGVDAAQDYYNLSYGESFYYGAVTNQPAKWLEMLYLQYQEEFDGVRGGTRGRNIHLILTHLLRMTPAEYVEHAKQDDNRPPIMP